LENNARLLGVEALDGERENMSSNVH